MEQRTEETRQPGVAAEDTGPPGDDKPGKAPAADESTPQASLPNLQLTTAGCLTADEALHQIKS